MLCRTLSLLTFAAASSQVLAQGTISDGPVSLSNGFGVPFSSTGANADLIGATAGDPLFHLGWGYRQTSNLGSNSLMGNFGVQGETYAGDTSMISFLNNGSGPAGVARFDAIITTRVEQTVSGARIYSEVAVTNVNATPLVLDLFQVVDWDLGPAPGGDNAALVSSFGGTSLSQSDDDEVASLFSDSATGYSPGGSATLRTTYSSGNADLNNASAFFGDAALALQWTLNLDPGETTTITSVAAFGEIVVRCPADQNEDGAFNNTDINIFVSNFLAMQSDADLNGDGFWNNADINLFVQLFLTNCL